MNRYVFFLAINILFSVALHAQNTPFLKILGTVQDAGMPQINCKKSCCASLFDHPDPTKKVVSLGLIDSEAEKTYLFEATPDIGSQLQDLQSSVTFSSARPVDGIFITHAHIGHYSGLMFLGKEAVNGNLIPVYAMPKMKYFLSNNGPWEQLVTNKNIQLKELQHETPVVLSKNLSVTPILVPHRDEYSETVGYLIQGPNKSALFIPDIDKWNRWEKDIIEEIKKVDYAFLDATFFNGVELNNRDMSEIPHPSIEESMALFKELSPTEKVKVIFIHFNHTNPALNPNSEAYQEILKKGFKVASYLDTYKL